MTTLINLLRTFLPLLLSVAVIALATVTGGLAGDIGKAVAFFAAFIVYAVAFFLLGGGAVGREVSAEAWLLNAFSMGALFIVGLSGLVG